MSKTTHNYDYDFLVIGAGSGGVRASRIAAGHGAKVAVVEESALGGTCVNVGCVPKKLLSYAAHFAHDFEDAHGYGWNVPTPDHNWQNLIQNKNTEIERLNGIYKNMLSNAGVDILDGHGRFVDDHTVEVEGKAYTADKILIAVGGWPVKPDISGAEHAITSNEAFYLNALPKRSVVIGGGFIAVEFASIFNGLGSDTILLHRGDKILRGFDDDIRTTLASEMEKLGVDVRLSSPMPKQIEKTDAGLIVTLDDGSTIETDCVMYAIGRSPKIDGLGLDAIDIKCETWGSIIVNDQYQTNIPHIYAVGDVCNKINLTPVALAEGHVLADRLFNADANRAVSYDNVAAAVFSHPPIGTVGLSEEDAQQRHGADNITVFTSQFRPMKHTLSGRDEKTFMKLIVENTTDKVIGCHMVGMDAPEILQGISIAINTGATKTDFDRTIGIHPTAAEEFVTMRTARD